MRVFLGALTLIVSSPALAAKLELKTASGGQIRLDYEVRYENRSSNKPSYAWLVEPLSVEVSNVSSAQNARLVFVNRIETTESCGQDRAWIEEKVYFVDLERAGNSLVGDLLTKGHLITNDGSVSARQFPPFTRLELYCSTMQSIGQSVSLVIDGVWQKTDLDPNETRFDLHLER